MAHMGSRPCWMSAQSEAARRKSTTVSSQYRTCSGPPEPHALPGLYLLRAYLDCVFGTRHLHQLTQVSWPSLSEWAAGSTGPSFSFSFFISGFVWPIFRNFEFKIRTYCPHYSSRPTLWNSEGLSNLEIGTSF